jgi:hypothetical protein
MEPKHSKFIISRGCEGALALTLEHRLLLYMELISIYNTAVRAFLVLVALHIRTATQIKNQNDGGSGANTYPVHDGCRSADTVGVQRKRRA